MVNLRHLALGEIIFAGLLWAVALWGVMVRQEYLLQWLYFLAWYPYILFWDGLSGRLRGESWLFPRPGDFLRMSFWSVTVWLGFEAINLVLKNWGYAGLKPICWVRWSGYALAFATVIPGILLTARGFSALGVCRGLQGRPRHLGTWQPFSLVLGTALLILPLIYPHYAFPLVWLAFIFLLDPFCQLLGGSSLIASWAAGERQEHYCLLAAGMLCGLWWEMWNYPATARWVYTLPVLNFGQVFEMPILGYLGFLPFALEAAVLYNFFKALHTRMSPRGRVYLYLGQLVFWILMFMAMDNLTVISYGKDMPIPLPHLRDLF